MLRSHLLLAALGTAGLLSAGVMACGDDGAGAGGQAAGGITPPPRPADAPPGDGAGKVFGTTKIFIGTKTRAGQESNDAWKDYGYDLDGQVTTTDFSGHCKPAGGGSPNNTFPDGNEGRDNAFGKVLLPLIKTVASSAGGADLEAELNTAIDEGSFNVMIDLSDLGDGPNYDPIAARLYAGKDGVVGTNTWKIAPEFLDGADASTAKVKFPTSYVTDNTWVSGDKGTLNLIIAIAGFELSLPINSALISMKMDSGHGGATEGVIAGILQTEPLIEQIRSIAGAFDPESFCEGTAVDGILNQIRQASDIMADGSQDPNATCDGISIGLGFDATAVTVDGVGDPADPVEDPCAPGEGGGGGGTGGAPGAGGAGGN